MRRKLLIALVLGIVLSILLPSAISANPGLTYYTSRTNFEADCSISQTEDFEEANIADYNVASFDEPLDSTTNNAYFSTGDIVAGLSIISNGDFGVNEIAIVGTGFMGIPSKSVFANYYINNLELVFTTGDVTCVGTDLFVLYSGIETDTFQIDIYGTGDILLGSTTATATLTGSFWGVCSDEVITRITFNSPSDYAEGVDNIAFGTESEPPGPTEPPIIEVGGKIYPNNSIWILTIGIMTVALLIGAGILIKRKVSHK